MTIENRKLYYLFAVTIFLGSGLLFLVQPMIAKAILPLAGGTPTVWNTCVFFFQGTLLLGYGYSFLITQKLPIQMQRLTHPLTLLTGAVATGLLFVAIDPPTPGQTNYFYWVLKYLTVSVGWVVLLLSANGIILQRWFATTTSDPYHLYAASNAGSFLALLAYPFLLEPTLSVTQQKRLWAGLFLIFVLAVVGCAWATRRNTATKTDDNTDEVAEPLTLHRKLRWVFLAFVPSSLMLGVTTYVTTDIAPAPLFWIIPLAIYLLAFTLAFARRQWINPQYLIKFLPGAAILMTLTYAAKATEPAWLLTIVHLLFFSMTALLAHQLIAEDRPAVRYLPEYYVWIAVGGLGGGLFNALLAPAFFNALTEYPLTIVLACLILPSSAATLQDVREQRRALLYAAMIGIAVSLLSYYASKLEMGMIERVAMAFAIPLLIINHLMTANPFRLALGLGAVLVGSMFFTPDVAKTLLADRNYFSPVKVTLDRDKTTRSLYHGTTIHGKQHITLGKQCEPLAYFHPTGPISQVFLAHHIRNASPNVAVIGLGTGAMAAYSRKGQAWTYYEINPLVIKLARDTGYFTYLQLCSRAPYEIIEGDARHTLTQAADGKYGLILMDAFNSDAIPIHLVTQEALELYLAKLAAGGMIAIHVSNRHLDIRPILANLVQSKSLVSLGIDDTSENQAIHKEPSTWVVIARQQEDFGILNQQKQWQPVQGNPRYRVWSDEYSNILQALR